MKTLLLPIVLGVALSGGLSAGPLYKLSFSGTITSGSAFGFNPALSGNSLSEFADLTGARVSGSLYYDLGVAPNAEVNTDPGGFITTAIQSASLPVFVRQEFEIEGFSVPVGFFPMPTSFDLPPVPSFPGSVVTVNNVNQSLTFSTQLVPSAQSVLGGMNFLSSWTGPRFHGGSISALAVLASSFDPFFPVPAAGRFPDDWSSPVPGQNGFFQFNVFSVDTTIDENFGVAQWYDVRGNFSLDFVGGELLVTPEPGTLGLSAAVLGLAWVAVRKRRVRTPHLLHM